MTLGHLISNYRQKWCFTTFELRDSRSASLSGATSQRALFPPPGGSADQRVLWKASGPWLSCHRQQWMHRESRTCLTWVNRCRSHNRVWRPNIGTTPKADLCSRCIDRRTAIISSAARGRVAARRTSSPPPRCCPRQPFLWRCGRWSWPADRSLSLDDLHEPSSALSVGHRTPLNCRTRLGMTSGSARSLRISRLPYIALTRCYARHLRPSASITKTRCTGAFC